MRADHGADPERVTIPLPLAPQRAKRIARRGLVTQCKDCQMFDRNGRLLAGGLVARSMATALMIAVCGLAMPAAAQDKPPAAQPPAGGKIPVQTADDLPRYTYKIEGKASDFLLSDKPFLAFVAQVRANVENTLAKYEISDQSTLQTMHSQLQQIALIEGRWDDAMAQSMIVKSLEGKESKKLMTGQVLTAMLAANKVAKNGTPEWDAVFSETLTKNVAALPWEKVREDVIRSKGSSELASREIILGGIQGQLDPIVEKAKGELSSDFAGVLIGSRATMEVMLPVLPKMGKVYAQIIDSHKTVRKDVLSAREVVLSETDAGTPVAVAVWDSGVDVSLFSQNLWVNTKEIPGNGKDDDGNGFVDDVNGIAYDLTGSPTAELLHPLTEMRGDPKLVAANIKGMMDLQANIDSPEAGALKKLVGSLKADQVSVFQEDLGLYGNYSHGTHVAGIAAEGNPFARLVPVRITFDFRQIPTLTPSKELAAKTAKAASDSVAYMKAAGVRVCNMSWGGSRQDVEQALEAKGVGKTPEERAAMSRELFKIEKDALEAAMKGAPEILFVAAAGNSDNDNQFAEFIPSGLNIPNMITIGAVDSSGKPTGFTTFGKNVKVYANGFEVNSYVPGGQKMKFSGTSMAAPNVTNLAAKLIALYPKLTSAQVATIIVKTSEPMEGYPERLVINPKKAVASLKPSN